MTNCGRFKPLGALLILAMIGLGVPLTAASHATYGKKIYQEWNAGRRVKEARPMTWHVLGRANGSRVRIGRNVEWCPESGSATRPRITGVKQVDRRHSVVLTAFIARRPVRNCGAVEILVERLVHIRGGLHGRPLYDGSKSPPVRRWPRGT